MKNWGNSHKNTDEIEYSHDQFTTYTFFGQALASPMHHVRSTVKFIISQSVIIHMQKA